MGRFVTVLLVFLLAVAAALSVVVFKPHWLPAELRAQIESELGITEVVSEVRPLSLEELRHHEAVTRLPDLAEEIHRAIQNANRDYESSETGLSNARYSERFFNETADKSSIEANGHRTSYSSSLRYVLSRLEDAEEELAEAEAKQAELLDAFETIDRIAAPEALQQIYQDAHVAGAQNDSRTFANLLADLKAAVAERRADAEKRLREGL